MAQRIVYDRVGSPDGKIMAEGVDLAIKALDKVNRAMSVANLLTGGGANPQNLEGASEFGVPVPSAITILSSSVANPTEITFSASHGFASGSTATFSGHSGSTPDINGDRVVTVISPTKVTIPLNVSVGGTGGTAKAKHGAAAYTAFNDLKSNLEALRIPLSELDNGG